MTSSLPRGFLASEGLLHDRHEVAAIRYCDVAPEMQHFNVVTVDLTVPFAADFAERHFFAAIELRDLRERPRSTRSRSPAR